MDIVPTPVLAVEALTKRYGRALGVEDVAFDVRPGEIVGLLGPNGSGKSTTLHCLTGILEPTSGSIEVAGVPHTRPEAKDAFGFLPDDLPMPESLRAREVIAMHRRLRSAFETDLAEQLLGLVGLAEHHEKYLGEYSHGMKRKLQLVIALAHRPHLLIFDEPMRGLDPEAGIILMTLLDSFREQGGAALIATHDLLAAEHSCDRVVVLADGHVIATGRPAELVEEAGVDSLEAYFVEVTGLAGRMAAKQDQLRALAFLDGDGRATPTTQATERQVIRTP